MTPCSRLDTAVITVVIDLYAIILLKSRTPDYRPPTTDYRPMTAHELLQYLTWFVYVLIFILVAIRAVRRPLTANVDIALFFLASTISIAFTFGTRLGLLPTGGIASAIST